MKPFSTALVVSLVALACVWPGAAAAQDRFEAAVQVTSAVSSEFDESDIGAGGRFSWTPRGLFGADAEIDFYPRNFPDSAAFSRSRIEGLFGVTVGPRFARVRPFGKFRPGFVTFKDAGRPIVCILIFPPPLSCVLAAGKTVFALDAGGGVELSAARRASIRVDVGDRLLKYPGPSFDNERTAHTDGFFSHDFRLAVGLGWKF